MQKCQDPVSQPKQTQTHTFTPEWRQASKRSPLLVIELTSFLKYQKPYWIIICVYAAVHISRRKTKNQTPPYTDHSCIQRFICFLVTSFLGQDVFFQFKLEQESYILITILLWLVIYIGEHVWRRYAIRPDYLQTASMEMGCNTTVLIKIDGSIFTASDFC